MNIQFTKTFSKQYRKVDIKIRKTFEEKLILFTKDPFNPLLNNHSLTGKLKDKRSINITGDWRALYSIYKKETELVIFFELIGTHSQFYK